MARSSLLFSRFFYGLRIAIPAACGALGMRPAWFALVNVAGALLWGIVIGLGGYLFGHAMQLLLHDLARHEWLVAGILLVAVFALLLWRGRDVRGAVTAFRRPRELGAESVARLSARAESREGSLLSRDERPR